MKVKIGCDPEFFLFDTEDKQYVSAHTFVPGTKEEPVPVPYGAIQSDGVAVEYNIIPANTEDEFVKANCEVLSYLRKLVPARYEFHFAPVAPFSKEYLNSLPEKVRALGCTPDYNAYTKKKNTTPNAEVEFRTASGHIHVGWTNDEDPYNPEHFEAACMLTKSLDYYLGMMSCIFEGPNIRRDLYGNVGAFRPKSYGMEYRVPSNWWLKHPEYMQMVYQATLYTINRLEEGRINPDKIDQISFATYIRGYMNYSSAYNRCHTIFSRTSKASNLLNNEYSNRTRHIAVSPLGVFSKEHIFAPKPAQNNNILRDERGRFVARR